MEIKTFKLKTPICEGTAEILACQTFEDPPAGDWMPCNAEDIGGLAPLMIRKNSLMYGRFKDSEK
jgi:hypothetical protein